MSSRYPKTSPLEFEDYRSQLNEYGKELFDNGYSIGRQKTIDELQQWIKSNSNTYGERGDPEFVYVSRLLEQIKKLIY